MPDFRYKIKRKLGQGYMGEVYHAWDTRYSREVALKFLPPRFTSKDDIARFRQESFILFKLNHPNIVQIYDFEQDIDPAHFSHSGYEPQQERVYFIVDEFIPGPNLRQYMTEKELSPQEALKVAIEIAKALGHAHSTGVVHRDVKPDNIMITPEGNVKVLDFGMGKLMDWFITQQLSTSEPQHVPLVITGQDEALGTALYMSPEQWGQVQGDHRSEIDERTDVWSLGVVLYEMLTRINPFGGRTKEEIRRLVAIGKPLPLSDHLGPGSGPFQRIVSKALRKDRTDRYQTIDQMLKDMEKLKQQLEGRSLQTRNYFIFSLALVIIVILVIMLIQSRS